MEKLKVGVVFGGMSTENEVSVVSASYVLSNLDKEKYEIKIAERMIELWKN